MRTGDNGQMPARIRELEGKLSRQKAMLAMQQDVLKTRSHQLDAMHWVWCTGCDGGVHRFADEDGVMRHAKLNEEVVAQAERNARRLRAWWENYKYRHQAANDRNMKHATLEHRIRYGWKLLRWWYRWRLTRNPRVSWPSLYGDTAPAVSVSSAIEAA
jgi:hypothetical protein